MADALLSVSRQLSPALETGVIDYGRIQATMDRYAVAMVEDAQDGWPVDTGVSRDAWEATVTAEQGMLGIALTNEARQPAGGGYSAYVHRSGEERLVWTEVRERLTADLVPNLQADILLDLAEEFTSG